MLFLYTSSLHACSFKGEVLGVSKKEISAFLVIISLFHGIVTLETNACAYGSKPAASLIISLLLSRE